MTQCGLVVDHNRIYSTRLLVLSCPKLDKITHRGGIRVIVYNQWDNIHSATEANQVTKVRWLL